MAKVSAVGPGTEAGKQLLADFKNWKETGFRPWGKGVGGKAHYESRKIYQVVTAAAFRAQAKKVAKIAVEQMPACDVQYVEGIDDDGKSLPQDSERKNPWERKLNSNSEDDNDDDEAYSSPDDEDTEDDGDAEDVLHGFDDIGEEELKNEMSAILARYPCGKKLLAVFPLDGNILDNDSNQFEFVDDCTAIRRWSKVPKERESAIKLVGLGTEPQSALGFTDVDLVCLDAVIQKRLKANEHLRDENGDIWEIRETLSLPFKCRGKFYNKKGKQLNTYRCRRNEFGFAWAYFWLLAWTPPRSPPRPIRFSGRMVTEISQDDSSVYTERTVRSSKKKKHRR